MATDTDSVHEHMMRLRLKMVQQKLSNEKERLLNRPVSEESTNNDMDEQIKLQQAMLRRTELMDKIRREQLMNDDLRRPRSYSARKRYTPSPLPPTRRSMPDLSALYRGDYTYRDTNRPDMSEVKHVIEHRLKTPNYPKHLPPLPSYPQPVPAVMMQQQPGVQVIAPPQPQTQLIQAPQPQHIIQQIPSGPVIHNLGEEVKHIIEHRMVPTPRPYQLPPIPNVAESKAIVPVQQPPTIIQHQPPQPQIITAPGPQHIIQQVPNPVIHNLVPDPPPKQQSWNKSDFMDMMMFQNAQMNNMVMQQMMMYSLPGLGGGLPRLGGPAVGAVAVDPMRSSQVHHHHYSGAPAAPPSQPIVHHYNTMPQMEMRGNYEPMRGYSQPSYYYYEDTMPNWWLMHVVGQHTGYAGPLPNVGGPPRRVVSPGLAGNRRTVMTRSKLPFPGPKPLRKFRHLGYVALFIALLKSNVRKNLSTRPSSMFLFGIILKEIVAALHRIYLNPSGNIYPVLNDVIGSNAYDLAQLLGGRLNSRQESVLIQELQYVVENLVYHITEIMPSTGVLGTHRKSACFELIKSGKRFPDGYFWQVEMERIQFSENGRTMNCGDAEAFMLLVGIYISRSLVTTILMKPVDYGLSSQPLTDVAERNLRILASVMLYLVRRISLSRSRLMMGMPGEIARYLYTDEEMVNVYGKLSRTFNYCEGLLREWGTEYIRRLRCSSSGDAGYGPAWREEHGHDWAYYSPYAGYYGRGFGGPGFGGMPFMGGVPFALGGPPGMRAPFHPMRGPYSGGSFGRLDSRDPYFSDDWDGTNQIYPTEKPIPTSTPVGPRPRDAMTA